MLPSSSSDHHGPQQQQHRQQSAEQSNKLFNLQCQLARDAANRGGCAVQVLPSGPKVQVGPGKVMQATGFPSGSQILMLGVVTATLLHLVQ
jgi:hypothetical protein